MQSSAFPWGIVFFMAVQNVTSILLPWVYQLYYHFNVAVEGVSKWREGLRSCPIMLNAGRGDHEGAEPGADKSITMPSP